MAPQLRALTALPEILSSIPSTHTVAHSHQERDLMPSSGVSEDSCSVFTYIKQISLLKKIEVFALDKWTGSPFSRAAVMNVESSLLPSGRQR